MTAKFIIGVDLGGTNLKTALLDLRCRIKKKEVLDTKSFRRKEVLVCALADSINRIIRNNRLHRKDILGIGLGLPGPIDSERGLVHYFPNIPGWREVNLKAILTKRLRLPVFLDNDANLMALAEYKLGAARGFKNALCLTLGTGVGGGIIIEGRLYRGSDFLAGEIGHLPINETGPRCSCGGTACLESYIGNNRILAEARRVFKRRVTLEELSRLARRHNRKAEGIWLDTGRRLGTALAAAVNLLNPGCIVIGGGVANAGRILFDKVKKTIKQRAMAAETRNLKVFKAALGDNAGLIGAAILVKEAESKE